MAFQQHTARASRRAVLGAALALPALGGASA
jgi:hypothetical protein